MNKTKKKTSKGFTLIEILVVIGIVAILAAIVLVAINPARQFKQANNSQRTSNVNAILNGIGQYIADNQGALPANADDGVPGTPEAISAAGADICSDLVPTYIPAFPVDPAAAGPNDCSAGYVTGYQIDVDADGRVTISAPSAELGANISVTR